LGFIGKHIIYLSNGVNETPILKMKIVVYTGLKEINWHNYKKEQTYGYSRVFCGMGREH
jgi:hypothetical protein